MASIQKALLLLCLFVIMLSIPFINAFTTTTYSPPMNQFQKQYLSTGTIQIEQESSIKPEPISFTFEIQPPEGFTEASYPIQATLQLYQHELILGESVIQITSNEHKKTVEIEIEKDNLNLYNYTIPLQLMLIAELSDTPVSTPNIIGEMIKSCIILKQGDMTYFDQCIPTYVTSTAIHPIDMTNNQFAFRSYCNGQAPPDPVAFMMTSIDNEQQQQQQQQPFDFESELDLYYQEQQQQQQQLQQNNQQQLQDNSNQLYNDDNIPIIQDITNTPCNLTQRFHINAYGLNVTSESSTLTFQILGHAVLRGLNDDGYFYPKHMSCRVNTHYISFHRVDTVTDHDVAFIPNQNRIYIAYNVKELLNQGIFEFECEKVGLYYPIYNQKDGKSILVPIIRYDTFVHITIANENDYSKEKYSRDDEQFKRWILRPSLSMYFNTPDMIAPFDFDIHSSSNVHPMDNSNTINNNNGIILTPIINNDNDSLSLLDNDIEYDLQLFGSFYLTQQPHKEDRIEICPLQITMKNKLTVTITQQNFNTTTNQTDTTLLIPLLQQDIELDETRTKSQHFIPGVLCYSIVIFDSDNNWRTAYTQTPQTFYFSIRTKVSNYNPNASIYTRFISNIIDEHHQSHNQQQLQQLEQQAPPIHVITRSIYAATPLPFHSKQFAKTISYELPKYDAETAEGHSTYSAKLIHITINDITVNVDRIAIVIAGNHYLNGDMECFFNYTSTQGWQVEEYKSARADKTVQSASMITFDLEEDPIDVKKTRSLFLECKGVFVVSRSYHNFNQQSILHLFGRDLTTQEFLLTTSSTFSIENAKDAPQPIIPIDPNPTPPQPDPKKNNIPWKLIGIIVGASLGGIILFIGLFILFRQWRLRVHKDERRAQSLLGEDEYLQFD